MLGYGTGKYWARVSELDRRLHDNASVADEIQRGRAHGRWAYDREETADSHVIEWSGRRLQRLFLSYAMGTLTTYAHVRRDDLDPRAAMFGSPVIMTEYAYAFAPSAVRVMPTPLSVARKLVDLSSEEAITLRTFSRSTPNDRAQFLQAMELAASDVNRYPYPRQDFPPPGQTGEGR